MSLKSHLAFLVLVVSALLVVPLSAQELDIRFQTSPPVDSMWPGAGLVRLSVLVSDGAGKPVESGWVDIRMDAPKRGGFFSTDIPLVESTTLVEMRLPLTRGKAEWRYAWPIRGEYRLAVEATASDGKRADRKFALSIRESPTKWLALAGFTLVLFLFGIVAGRILTAKTVNAAIFLPALLVCGTAAFDRADAAIPQFTEQPTEATLSIEPAVVGKPARILWRLVGAVSREHTLLTVEIEQLEESHKVFAVEKLPVAGEFALNFQFVDGSEHRVTVLAEIPGRAPIRIEQRVSVIAVEPPATAALPAVAFFLFVITFGLGVGRWSKLRGAKV